MFFTYILRSITNPKKTYIGYTSNLEERLKSHNQGKSTYTKHFIPWKIIYYAAFPERKTAMNFEKYLKSASGKAFASKHFDIK